MSNLLAVTLEKEVTRLTQNELRRALAALTAEVTALKKKVDTQERKLATVAASAGRRAAAATPEEGPPLDPTTIRAIRKRLGLSQASLAKVVSVTPVAVYFWEAGRTRPRGQRRTDLLELKDMSKRDAQARLATIVEEGPTKTRPRAGARGKAAKKKATTGRASGRKKKPQRKK